MSCFRRSGHIFIHVASGDIALCHCGVKDMSAHKALVTKYMIQWSV